MTPFHMVLLVLAAVLSVAALVAVHRVVVGPTILDRAVGSDFFVVTVCMAMALLSAATRTTLLVPAMLVLTGIAFIGSVSIARFVSRQDSPAAEAKATSGATDHGESIHPDSGTHHSDEHSRDYAHQVTPHAGDGH